MTVGHEKQARSSSHDVRRRLALWLVAATLTWLPMAACGSASAGTMTPTPRVPRAPEEPSSARARHGFDPREYYDKRALSVQRGAASFYADRFQGRMTANGERYDPSAYTAAHRTLPFGTILRVVYEKNGDWVLVRVNDRGPYGPGKRIVDLSREAARRLSMLRDGVVRVRLEVLELGSGRRRPKRPSPAQARR